LRQVGIGKVAGVKLTIFVFTRWQRLFLKVNAGVSLVIKNSSSIFIDFSISDLHLIHQLQLGNPPLQKLLLRGKYMINIIPKSERLHLIHKLQLGNPPLQKLQLHGK
jgi:hypothetical protein